MGEPSDVTRAIAVPAGRARPAAGLVLMIAPSATVALFANVSAPSVKPAARISS